MTKQHQELLSRAIVIAALVHEDQLDRGGKPYILHPLHLMSQLLYDTELATIAILHDVIEDSEVTLQMLAEEGFSERVLVALDLLTHRDDDSYEDYIEGICTNYDALRVKRKDIEHNSSITRLKGVSDKDTRRMKKYHRAFIRLGVAKKVFQL